jgi:hypothetical protein
MTENSFFIGFSSSDYFSEFSCEDRNPERSLKTEEIILPSFVLAGSPESCLLQLRRSAPPEKDPEMKDLRN